MNSLEMRIESVRLGVIVMGTAALAYFVMTNKNKGKKNGSLKGAFRVPNRKVKL